MAYTIDDFPFSTDNPQIEVTLPVGTHMLELVVEDSAGLRSLPDTVVVTVEREEVSDRVVTGIEPLSGLAGKRIEFTIRGTGLAGATGITFYRQISVTRPTITTPTIAVPTRLIGTLIPMIVADSTLSADIVDSSDTEIQARVTIDDTAEAGARSIGITFDDGTLVRAGAITFNVIRRLPTPTFTITRPTITVPTATIPTATITRPTITIPTATITRPTVTIPTATITRPTMTIPTATITRPTVTIPTATITRPTVTIPTATITRPTATIPTVTITRPTLTIPTATVTRPTTIPTATLTRPTVSIPTATLTRPIIMGENVMLTSVKGVGAATADKLMAAGINSVAALASANAKDVAKTLGYQDITRAQALVDEAKKLMG